MAKRQAEKKCFIGFWFDFRFGQARQLQYNTPELCEIYDNLPTTLGPMKYFSRPTAVSVGPTTPIWT